MKMQKRVGDRRGIAGSVNILLSFVLVDPGTRTSNDALFAISDATLDESN